MIAHMLPDVLPTASDTGNGYFSRISTVRSSGAEISSVAASIACPNVSRLAQRCTLAAASRPSTLVPSWNVSPSRKVSRHFFPSSSTTWPSSICG